MSEHEYFHSLPEPHPEETPFIPERSREEPLFIREPYWPRIPRYEEQRSYETPGLAYEFHEPAAPSPIPPMSKAEAAEQLEQMLASLAALREAAPRSFEKPYTREPSWRRPLSSYASSLLFTPKLPNTPVQLPDPVLPPAILYEPPMVAEPEPLPAPVLPPPPILYEHPIVEEREPELLPAPASMPRGADVLTSTGRTRGAQLRHSAAVAGITVPEGMVDGIPFDAAQSRGYIVGALAAARRRMAPPASPAPFVDKVEWPDSYGSSVNTNNLPEIAEAVVERIRAEMPELIIAADRGARYFGLAVYNCWRARYPDVPFPTIDGKLQFGRISRAIDEGPRQRLIDDILNRSGVRAEILQRRAEGNQRPVRIWLLDDWIGMGRTINMMARALENSGPYRAGRDFAYTHITMVGDYHGDSRCRHIVAAPTRCAGSSWDNEGQAIGVSFGDDGDPTRGRRWMTSWARENRDTLYRSISEHYAPPARS